MRPIPLDESDNIPEAFCICSIHQKLHILSSVRHAVRFLMDMGTCQDSSISVFCHRLRLPDFSPSLHAIWLRLPYDYKVRS